MFKMRRHRFACGWAILPVLLGLAAGTAWGEMPRPEHPRPDFQRDNWLNLNGEWQFEIDAGNDGEARGLISGKNLASKILVPFCPESKLSGVGHTDHMKHVWYRRFVELPAAMKGQRVLLHFGGVDYKTWVYVNGRLAGTHIGGSAAFCFDVTRLLRDGKNEIVVRVFDDTASGMQAAGKQSFGKSEGCVYTRTTGIWQTVWMEAVPASYIAGVWVVPDPDRSRVLIEAAVDGPADGLTLTAEAVADGKPVGSESTAGGWRDRRLVLNLSEKKLWMPGSPFLYDLKLRLARGNEKIDEVKSYFGLRQVRIDGRRILINGQPIFQRLILDQGFYPEGIWTAPTDDELRKDIERSMAAGYNGARLHQKVFEPRFMYWADKLGYLVWGEFPNWGYGYAAQGYSAYINEWTELLLRDRNHPSIVGWCPFNETPGEAGELQQIIWNVTKAVDPTRPVLETSGWSHTIPHPEVLDAHDYDQNPASFRQRWVNHFAGRPGSGSPMPARYVGGATGNKDRGLPFMVSEFGGIGWATEGGWGYGSGPKTLDEFYERYKGLVDAQLDNPNLFGFCYTQLTDIEQEKNGLYYYDRRPKFDLKRLHAITSREAAYERRETGSPAPAAPREVAWKVLVGAEQDGPLCRPWSYATEAPEGEWTAVEYDAKGWKVALAPFGRDTGRPTIRTAWATPDIYLRRTFEFDAAELKAAAIVLSHDEDTEIYVNGQKILAVKDYVTDYRMHDVTEALRKAIRQGVNTIAVHTHQTVGGQFIDVALLVQ